MFNSSPSQYQFTKYINSGLTLQTSAKKRFDDILMNIDLYPEEVEVLRTHSDNDTTTTKQSTNKRETDGNRKYPKEDPNISIVFLAFKLSTKKSDLAMN